MLTGTETRPKEIVAVLIDLAGITEPGEGKWTCAAPMRTEGISNVEISNNLMLIQDTHGRKW